MGELSDLQKGQIVGARLAEGSLTKTATSLGVSRAAVHKIRTAIQTWEDAISWEKTVVEIQNLVKMVACLCFKIQTRNNYAETY